MLFIFKAVTVKKLVTSSLIFCEVAIVSMDFPKQFVCSYNIVLCEQAKHTARNPNRFRS